MAPRSTRLSSPSRNDSRQAVTVRQRLGQSGGANVTRSRLVARAGAAYPPEQSSTHGGYMRISADAKMSAPADTSKRYMPGRLKRTSVSAKPPCAGSIFLASDQD